MKTRFAGRVAHGLAFAWMASLVPGAWAEAVVHPAENHDPAPGPAGAMPYEMAGRPEPSGRLFDFADVSGWEVEGHNAEGWLYRSEDQRLWSPYCGKLVYVGRGEKPVVIVRPRRPIPVPEPWDLVNWWTFGNAWGWSPDPKTPFLGTAIRFRDADGKEFVLNPGTIDHAYWFMMCARLGAGQKAGFRRPFSLVGLEFQGGTNAEPRTIYLGPCCFTAEQLRPLSFEPWPDRLPFPTRPETILPANKTAEFRNEVIQDGTVTRFVYSGIDTRIEYCYTPATGTLGDIEVLHKGQRLRPCAGGGIQWAGPDGSLAPDAPACTRALQFCELAGNTLKSVWAFRAGNASVTVSYRLMIRQKSLVVDIAADQPAVEKVLLGRASPVVQPRLFRVPYLTYSWNNTDPHVLLAGELFLMTQFDWYVSDASKLWGAAKTGPDWAEYNGCAEYTPKTDGVRNLVRERLFINVSPDVQEVLPGIPNPPSPFREMQGDRLWRVKDGGNHAAEVAEAKRLRALGCDRMTIRYHEDSWRDGGESFTFRLDAAPGRGGDEALRRFVAEVRSLGWNVGLYSNYTDFAPVNAYWDSDHVIRLPSGDWQRAWMRCYAPKPMWGVQMQARLAPAIREKFGTNHSYCDVHTVFMPSEREDYDARVPGAATFRRTYECFGRILCNEKVAYQGPVYSEGRNHWIYAGLVDGNYAQIAGDAPSREPLFVDFDLLKIHPLEMDAGLGSPGMFFKNQPYDLEQFIATTLAYGHIGFAEWTSTEGLLKIYNLVQPAQQRYAMEPVGRIAYESAGRMVGTSEALASGAYRRGRVQVVYQNGTEVRVNGSDEPWEVGAYTLPRWGHLVTTDSGRLVSASAVLKERAAGRRIDVSMTDGCRYLDSRGAWVSLGDWGCEGAAILKKDGADWYLIPAGRLTRFGVAPAVLGLPDDGTVEAVGLTADGTVAERAEVRRSGRLLEIVPSGQPALRYRLRPASRSE